MRRSYTRTAALLAAGSIAAPLMAAETMLEYRVSPRDTLIGLSEQVFTSPRAWREIARINRLPDPNRIYPGQVLRVPARLMRSTALPVRIASTIGEVRSGGAAVEAGAVLAEGQALETAPKSSAVLELADGSRVRVPPATLAEIVASRSAGPNPELAQRTANEGWFTGVLRMVRGSVEVLATKVRRQAPLEVTTPTAVVGVRGTHYRIRFDDEAPITRSEVLEGKVRLDSADRKAGTDLPAGFGGTQAAAGPAAKPTPLLPAPDLAAMPELFERPLVRFALPTEQSTVRVQVAVDPAFDKIVDDQRVVAGSDVRITGLPDARWYLRARRLDAQGIEGYDAVRPFVLKARPEPPAINAPRPGGKQSLGPLELQWSPNLEAASVRLQVARDEQFQAIVLQREGLAGNRERIELPEAGSYWWRLASTRADGDRGPFGDPQRFELRPLPEPPKGGVAADGRTLAIAWGGRPGDTQHVELARDPAFKEIVTQADLDQPEWNLPLPRPGGTYYFRYRSIEPDGFVGPYSTPLVIEVPRDWTTYLLMLSPLLLLL
ncbi:FecR domain-containing protein [Piscinibacter defluvii]|uniref:FecR domain-containing protein n=1 Tax=Piscinibacter defluvii TaxID=1796922 RepID=UPI000FDECAE7|nr:FecR domain-containing protein [Piscinibacter defluvii]